MDLYSPLLAKLVFPAIETVRGRSTVPLLQFLRGSEHWSIDALRDLQAGLLRRLIRHAAVHTTHYRTVLADRGLAADDIAAVADLRHLPVLDRATARETRDARTAGPHGAPPPIGDAPLPRGLEAETWRDASRWRGFGWAGYQIGMRAVHYGGEPRPAQGWLARGARAIDRVVRRDLHLDGVVRSERALAAAVDQIAAFQPEVIVAGVASAASLARYINEHTRGARRWRDTPVIAVADWPVDRADDRLWPHDRRQIEAAFGPVFETRSAPGGMVIGAECEAHDGLHVAMESAIVEIVVRMPGGGVRAARVGEVGEIAITDLHDLARPMIRYLTGDHAIARGDARCACGRGLATIGSISGRVAEGRAEYVDEIAPGSADGRSRTAARPAAPRAVMLA